MAGLPVVRYESMRVPAMFLALCFTLPALAWNNLGHRVCAAITYDHLTPNARARVDELIRRHPDYGTLLTRDSPPDPEARARAAFIMAASWPDAIRGDKRFYDESMPDIAPTPLLAGFPDMKKHTDWHYVDTPYSPEGVRAEDGGRAVQEITRLLTEITDEAANRAYDLPWLIHIEEDLHQPLHTMSRFLKLQPKGDEGGNEVFFLPASVGRGGRLYRTMHSIWDGAAGTDTSDANITKLAGEFVAAYWPDPNEPLEPARWVDEGFILSVRSAYTFGLGTGTKEMPLEMPDKYEANVRKVAQAQIARAGLRMAAILNGLFN